MRHRDEDSWDRKASCWMSEPILVPSFGRRRSVFMRVAARVAV